MTANDPGDAIMLVDAQRDPVDLLVTDVLMPGLNGQDLAESVRARWPRMKVLFMSGYPIEDLRDRGVILFGDSVLGKPLTVDSVVRAVRAALGRELPRTS